MAYLANMAFEPRVTNNEFDALCNLTGKYQESSAAADCSPGLLCVRDTLLPCEGFGSEVFNENAYYMVAADSTATAPIYACNPHDAQMGTVAGNHYYIGAETLQVGVPADRYGCFTKIAFDNVSKYRFGVGILGSASLTSDAYFVLAGDGLLSQAAAAPSDAGTPYFVLMGKGTFTEGTTNSFGYVDLEAHLA